AAGSRPNPRRRPWPSPALNVFHRARPPFSGRQGGGRQPRHGHRATLNFRGAHTKDRASLRKFMGIKENLAELERRNREALLGGGEERIAKRHAEGKGSARDRIDQLLDPRSESTRLNSSHDQISYAVF